MTHRPRCESCNGLLDFEVRPRSTRFCSAVCAGVFHSGSGQRPPGDPDEAEILNLAEQIRLNRGPRHNTPEDDARRVDVCRVRLFPGDMPDFR